MGNLKMGDHSTLDNAPNVSVVDCDVLIIGSGPAGSSLASFLASYGRVPNPV